MAELSWALLKTSKGKFFIVVVLVSVSNKLKVQTFMIARNSQHQLKVP